MVRAIQAGRLATGQLFLLLASVCAAACVPARTPRTVEAHALQGIDLGVPEPADARDTPGIGCGQIVQDLSARAHRQVVIAFSNAGANVSNSDGGPWVLKLALREAGMGLENASPRRSDGPIRQGPADAPDINTPQPSLFNSGNGHAQVVIDATLVQDGTVVWRETVTGDARSGPCIEAYDKVREALGEAIDEVRDRVIVAVKRHSRLPADDERQPATPHQ
jgi:hypothetical protein